MAFDAGTALSATNPWLAAGKFAIDTIGGGMAAGAQQENQNADRQQRWQEFLAQLAQQQSEQGDARGRTAEGIASKQAMQPLADRGFSALQSRFSMGPATFGHTGEQNQQMQTAAANYRPGQNPSMQQYGADLQSLKDRFMAPPAPVQPPYSPASGQAPPIDPATGKPDPDAARKYLESKMPHGQGAWRL